MGEIRNAYNIFVGKPEMKRPLGRPRHRWVDTIRMDLREMGLDVVDWMQKEECVRTMSITYNVMRVLRLSRL
jgi:hypothetical protein